MTSAEDLNGGGDDGAREARQLNKLAEHRAQQKHREVEFYKPDHFFHKQTGKGRSYCARVGEQYCAEGGDRGKEDNAISSIGRQHQ